MKKLKLLDTFSGIGGFSYAAEKLVGGFETTQFIEIDPYCQKVLKKHWPNVPIHDDIKTFTAEPFQFNAICGGFPCQDISTAGRGKGITQTTRSGLFYELLRVIRMVRPKYVILENVAAILNNGLDIVLAELYETGYDAEWTTFPASLIGAAHQRDRWWLVAYPNSKQSSGTEGQIQAGRIFSSGSTRSGNVADPNYNGSFRTEESRSTKETNGRSKERKDIIIESEGSGESKNSGDIQLSITNTDSLQRFDVLRQQPEQRQETQQGTSDRNNRSGDVTNSESKRTWKDESRLWGQFERGNLQEHRDSNKKTSATSNSDSNGLQRKVGSRIHRATWKTQNIRRLNPNWRQYVSQPTICRGDDGLRGRVDRLKALGNSVVPQCAAIPLQRVLDLENERQS